ncbi:hypothetical protein DIPPA_17276 [Diplonema papillatum]|nr:hypothetical protein DIPPA_17276 [Diplonema papillatum]
MRRTLRVLCPGIGPEALLGDWGYGANFYSIRKEADGTVVYKEEYPKPVGDCRGVLGVVKAAANDETTTSRLVAVGIKPQCQVTLNEQAGMIWFEKDGGVVKSLYVSPGTPLEHGMRQIAVAIVPSEERLKQNTDERAERMRSRMEAVQRGETVSAKLNRFTLYFGLVMVFNAMILYIPDDE